MLRKKGCLQTFDLMHIAARNIYTEVQSLRVIKSDSLYVGLVEIRKYFGGTARIASGGRGMLRYITARDTQVCQ